MKKLVVFLLLVSLFSCKNSKGDKNVGEANLSEQELLNISKTVCPENQFLKLLDSTEKSNIIMPILIQVLNILSL